MCVCERSHTYIACIIQLHPGLQKKWQIHRKISTLHNNLITFTGLNKLIYSIPLLYYTPYRYLYEDISLGFL